MRRILSLSSTRKLVVTCVAVGALMLAYEATTFDLLPWGGQSGGVDPAAPVPGARLQFTATAYCKGTTTASGAEVRTGIAAADDRHPAGRKRGQRRRPRTPGTTVSTRSWTRVRAVQGRLIDLYMWSCHEALAFGRKPIQVTVLRLGWNPRASTPSLIDRLFRRGERARDVAPPIASPARGR